MVCLSMERLLKSWMFSVKFLKIISDAWTSSLCIFVIKVVEITTKISIKTQYFYRVEYYTQIYHYTRGLLGIMLNIFSFTFDRLRYPKNCQAIYRISELLLFLALKMTWKDKDFIFQKNTILDTIVRRKKYEDELSTFFLVVVVSQRPKNMCFNNARRSHSQRLSSKSGRGFENWGH